MSSSLLLSFEQPALLSLPSIHPSHPGDYVYAVHPLPLRELFSKLSHVLCELGVNVTLKPFSLACSSFFNGQALFFSVNMYQNDLIEFAYKNGDRMSFGQLMKTVRDGLTHLFAQHQPYLEAKRNQMLQWCEQSRRAVIDHQMNIKEMPLPVLTNPVLPTSAPGEVVALPLARQARVPMVISYVTKVLGDVSSKASDTRLDSLYTLIEMVRSGEFQKIVTQEFREKRMISLQDFSIPSTLDGGAIDVLLGVLRTELSSEAVSYCDEIMLEPIRASLCALANLIEYISEDVVPGDTLCPRLSVSLACAKRLIQVGGVQTLLEAVCSSQNGVQMKREAMRATLAIYRHMQSKEEVMVDRVLLAKVLKKNHDSTDSIIAELNASLSRVVAKLLKQ